MEISKLKQKVFKVKSITPNGYLICENSDKELVEKIKLFNTNKLLRHNNEYVVESEINENEYLCKYIKDDAHFIINKTILEEDKKESHLYYLNEEFKISDYYLKNFNVIKSGNYIFHNIVPIEMFGRKINFYKSGVNPTLLNENYYIQHYKNNIKFTHILSHNSFYIYFNEEGDYVIRNYNIPYIDGEYKSLENTKEEFFQSILEFGNLEYCNDIWYNDYYAIFVNDHYERNQLYSECKIEVEVINKRKNAKGYQNYKGEDIIHKPKNTTLVTSEHLLTYIKSKIKEPKFDEKI